MIGTAEYDFVSPADREMWSAYRDIRRRVLFEARSASTTRIIRTKDSNHHPNLLL